MQAHLTCEAVDLTPVVLFDGGGDDRPRDGTQRAVGHLDHVGDVGSYGIDSRQSKSRFSS